MNIDTSPLVIGRIEAFPVDLPLHTPINLGGRFRVDVAATLFVRIETRDGLTGWGECAPAPYLGGETREALLEALDAKLVPALAGKDAGDIDGLMAAMNRAVPGNLVAKAAIDCALYNLLGKARGVPVCDLLGGAKRRRLDAMWMVGTPSVEQDAVEATAKRRAGYRVFKLKVGSRPLDQDLAATRAVRAAIGPDAALTADANGTMDVERAIAYGKQAVEFGVMFLEQPVKADDIDGMARIAAAIPVPVCPDESVKTMETIELMAAKHAGSGAVLRVAKFGGLGPLHRAAARCRALGWKVNLPGKIAESSVATAGLLHVAAAAEQLDWFVTATNHYLAIDVVKPPLTPRDGAFDLPAGPGLGVEVDEAVVKEYRAKN